MSFSNILFIVQSWKCARKSRFCNIAKWQIFWECNCKAYKYKSVFIYWHHVITYWILLVSKVFAVAVKHQIDHITITGLCHKLQFFTVKRYIFRWNFAIFFLIYARNTDCRYTTSTSNHTMFTTSRGGTYLRNVVFRRGFVSIWSLERLQYDNSSNHE